MTTNAKPKSRILDAVHETAVDLHRLGFIDERKMLKYDVLCLEPVPLDEIRYMPCSELARDRALLENAQGDPA